jgi:virulence-associated protein VapD
MIKTEADNLLKKYDLQNYLSKYGEVFVQGSYYLNLMTWRDLDINLAVKDYDVMKHFEIGSYLAKSLDAYKMSYRNETIRKTDNYPSGYYWGLYFYDSNYWKIDLWVISYNDLEKSKRQLSNIKTKLTPKYIESIKLIKLETAKRKNYRKEYYSIDIYKAVLENGINNVGGFIKYLDKKGIEY